MIATSLRTRALPRPALTAVLSWAVSLTFGASLLPQEEGRPASETAAPSTVDASDLELRYQEWLASVRGLISDEEVAYFVALDEDYRRDAFMEAFWRVRDPTPGTTANEFRERWDSLQRSVGGPPAGDARALAFILNGPPGRYSLPDGRNLTVCYSRTRELEIWFYGGSERTAETFIVVFEKRAASEPYEVWRPGLPLRPIQRSSLPTRNVQLLCADELIGYVSREIGRHGGYDRVLDEVLSAPLPSKEWLETFAGSSTEPPADADLFEVSLDLSFPARRQSRTAVQALLTVPTDAVPGREFSDGRYQNLLLIGEVIRDGQLFETFRYTFEGRVPEGASSLPIGFTRYLRSGEISLRLLLKDVYGQRYAHVVENVDVPSPQGLPVVRRAAPQVAVDEGPSIRLVEPRRDVLVGLVRFNTRVRGEPGKVTFFLDDQPVISKRRAPWSVELDLGDTPQPHRVRVVAYDSDDEEIATDQLWLNQGAQRFQVRLIEPRAGGIYPGSTVARIEVQTPDGKPPARVEVFVNDDTVASLDKEPWAAVIELPESEPAVVRAKATLEDGSHSEDVVLVGSEFVEQVAVQLVELFVLALDGQGRPVENLTGDDFRLLDNDSPRPIERFSYAGELPIQAALVVDRSASMEPHLRAVAEAANKFATTALTNPEDRVAVVSFAAETRVEAPLTRDTDTLERALLGLNAFGRTALYDGIAQSVNTFEGLEGQKALVLFSDGQDELSRISYDQAVDAARHAGVTVYVVGLEEMLVDRDTRRTLERLADETGGRALFVGSSSDLDAAYLEILAELRHRYLIAFQRSRTGGDYHTLTVEGPRGVRVLTRRGYYP